MAVQKSEKKQKLDYDSSQGIVPGWKSEFLWVVTDKNGGHSRSEYSVLRLKTDDFWGYLTSSQNKQLG